MYFYPYNIPQMEKEQDVKPKQPAFMITINFNGKQWITSFMCKDISKEAVAYLLGMNLAQFLEQSTANTDEYMWAMDKFLVGLEEVTEKILWPLFKDDKKKSTAQIVAQLKESRGAKLARQINGVDKQLNTRKKTRTTKKK